MFKLPLLSILLGVSLMSSGVVLIGGDKQNASWAHRLALISILACLSIGGLLYLGFDPNGGIQFQETWLWIKPWHIQYAVGIDGLSLGFILLTLFINLITILSAWNSALPKPSEYFSCLLLIQTLLIGSFTAIDAIFFYICWEALLIPMFLMIGRWGSQHRAYASIKFFLYTFLGSAGLLIALIYLGYLQESPNFLIQNFYAIKLTRVEQLLLFLAFFVGFTIKIPLWPLHTWLPDAHTEAPTEGSIVLAALMLKLGGYGLLRFCLPIVPDAARELAPLVCCMSIIAIFYAGFIAFAQSDMKRFIAYSSISHMGMVVLGIFLIFLMPSFPQESYSLPLLSLAGATLHMISHAFSTTGLFLVVGILYKRFRSRTLTSYSGLANIMPTLTGFLLLYILSSIGLPGTAGFVGEFLVILSAAQAHVSIGFLASLTLLLSAGYTLIFYKKLSWGITQHPPIEHKHPLYLSEHLALLLLGITILLIGIYPEPYLNLLKPALETLLHSSLQTKL